jgi:RNA polymerase sigma-70 factor (ECF subfamily)
MLQAAPQALPRLPGPRPEGAAGPAGPLPRADRIAIRRILEGDADAFAGLVKRYQGPFLRLAGALLRDAAAAEEVVQDTWLAILDGLSRFEGRSSLKSWMFHILANRARTRRAREGRSVPFSRLRPEGGDDAEAFDADGRWAVPPRRWEEESPERLLARAEARAAVEAAVAELPPGQRAVITLRDVEGLESDEICRVLGITPVNQRVLLHRARGRIRAALQAAGAGP